MHFLITGGAGYIGSHTVLELLKRKHEVTVIDNLSNSDMSALDTIRKTAGNFEFIKVDLCDAKALNSALLGKQFDACIHFAGLIEVGRSVLEPEIFFANNVTGSINLFSALTNLHVDKIIFSSTAAVYGTPKSTPIPETADINTENPYGNSKYIIERVLADLAKFKGLKAMALRYFNPAGSAYGLIGENHQNETHVIPRLLRSITKPDEYKFKVFGTDYPTADGTAIRDYVHILDLVDAHIAAVEYLNKTPDQFSVFNVGTGKGTSVFELIKTAEEVTGQKINFELTERRAGDSPVLVAGVDKIAKAMGWKAKFTLRDTVQSAWRWEKK